MADFRKCLYAFAVLVLLSSFAVPASAQFTPSLQCTFNAAVTPTVRAEGLTELVGDIVLDCTGGTPTLPTLPVPQGNITVFLNTNLTSRITSTNGNFSEVLMIIDEPHSPSNPAIPMSACSSVLQGENGGPGICQIAGTNTPPGIGGVGTYNGSGPSTLLGVAIPGRPNAFQARISGVNQVTFFGVPIDPPGTNGHRIIRITNVRGNANQLGTSQTLIPTQIVANISVNPPSLLPINNPQQTVAYIQRGLVSSVHGPVNFIQCIGANPNIATNPSNGLGGGTTQDLQQFLIRFDEGFASSFKEKNIATHLANETFPTSAAALAAGGTVPYPADNAQDIPRSAYNSESGFEVNGVFAAIGTIPPGFGPFDQDLSPGPSTSFAGAGHGLGLAGTANAGTRLLINFAAISTGAQLFVPTKINLIVPSNNNQASGLAVLVNTDANGGGGFSQASGNSAGLAQVSITGGTGIAVYEIVFDDPFQLERLNVPVAVAFVANQGNNLPQPNLQSTTVGSFAPLSNVGTSDSVAPIPRFAPGQTPLNTFIIAKCSCNILFPFVSNQQGFDTGVAIANTTVDPFGTTPQAGLVTLNYYSGGTPPPAQTTTSTVPGGQELLFTLSGGGNFGIAAVPGFQGYIIATAQFQFCHAFAYISAQGALPTAPGASEGYLGIVLDTPALNRTGQVGEVQAH
jgi:hypothetical protein